MMKRFMTSGAPHGGGELARDLRGRGTMLIPGKATWLVETQAPTHCDRDPGNSMPSKTLPTLYVVPCDPRE
jgi:hypothetical protein